MDIRILPAQTERVETGPVQFGEDWPGVFIRGDNAFGLLMALEWVFDEDAPADELMAMQAKAIIPLLKSCILGPAGATSAKEE